MSPAPLTAFAIRRRLMAHADAASVPGPQRFRYAIEKFPESE
jgi:hypothetical protein